MKYSAIDPPYLATKCSIRYYRNEADRVLCIKLYSKVIKHYCARLHIAPTYIVQMNLICNFACQVSGILVFTYRQSVEVFHMKFERNVYGLLALQTALNMLNV